MTRNVQRRRCRDITQWVVHNNIYDNNIIYRLGAHINYKIQIQNNVRVRDLGVCDCFY